MPAIPLTAGLVSPYPGPASLLLGFLLAAGCTAVLSLLVLRACVRVGILDQPAMGRVHNRPVPRLGGIAIFVSFFTISLLLFRPDSPWEGRVYLGLILAAILVVGVMAWDDIYGLPPLFRLAVQTVAAGIAMYPGGHATLIQVLNNPLISAHNGQTMLPLWVAIPFTWFWITGMMNTINWVDGLDGLAGGVVTIAAIVMAAVSWLLGQHSAALLCAILAGATLGFLPWNWHPARLFMGDSGAMFLGLALAVLSNVGGAKLATMLLLLGVPILDAARVIVRRVRKGRSPLHWDRSHLHHRLLAGGLTQRQIALLFYLVTALFGSITILSAYLQTRIQTWSWRSPLVPGIVIGLDALATVTGLVLVAVVSLAIWRVSRVRRVRAGVPPGDSSSVLPRPPHVRDPVVSSGGHRKP